MFNLNNRFIFFERCSLITSTVCAYKLNNARSIRVFAQSYGYTITFIKKSFIPKDQVSFSDHYLSVVRRCRCFINDFSHFLLLLQNHWANFNRTWQKESLSEGDSSLIKWRATRPISTKFGTKHSWVRGIVAYSKEGPRPFIRGDSYEIPKIHWWNYSPESQGRLQPNLAQSILGWRGLKCVQIKGPTLPNGEIITKKRKHIDEIKKKFPLQNHIANSIQTWHKAFLGKGNLSLFKWKALSFSKGR